MNDTTKRCTSCKIEKPLSEFYKNVSKPDGYGSRCRTCERARDVARYNSARNDLHGSERLRDKWNRRGAKDRELALAAYGGPVCAHCGETNPDLLQLDHIAEDGKQHRAECPSARKLARYLRLAGFPPGFQVLCGRCNTVKHWRSKHPNAALEKLRGLSKQEGGARNLLPLVMSLIAEEEQASDIDAFSPTSSELDRQGEGFFDSLNYEPFAADAFPVLTDGDWSICPVHGFHGAAENGEPLSFCEKCEER